MARGSYEAYGLIRNIISSVHASFMSSLPRNLLQLPLMKFGNPFPAVG